MKCECEFYRMLGMVRALGQHWAKGNRGESGGSFLSHGSDLEQGSECWGSESRKEGHVGKKRTQINAVCINKHRCCIFTWTLLSVTRFIWLQKGGKYLHSWSFKAKSVHILLVQKFYRAKTHFTQVHKNLANSRQSCCI